MSYIVRDLTPLKATSSASTVTNGIGHLDDASSITLFITSSYSGSSTGAVIQISQFDPSDPLPISGVSQSTGWYALSTASVGQITSSGTTIALSNISFRGLRIGTMTSSTAAADVIAYVSKQITV